MQNLNPNIIHNFSNNSEELIKSKYSNTEEVISTLESNLEKGFIDENEFLSSLNTIELLEKGGKRAMVGEKRMFGGREYIKTPEGWKFHGKGTGAKAIEHSEKHGVKEEKEEEAPKKKKQTFEEYTKEIEEVKKNPMYKMGFGKKRVEAYEKEKEKLSQENKKEEVKKVAEKTEPKKEVRSEVKKEEVKKTSNDNLSPQELFKKYKVEDGYDQTVSGKNGRDYDRMSSENLSSNEKYVKFLKIIPSLEKSGYKVEINHEKTADSKPRDTGGDYNYGSQIRGRVEIKNKRGESVASITASPGYTKNSHGFSVRLIDKKDEKIKSLLED